MKRRLAVVVGAACVAAGGPGAALAAPPVPPPAAPVTPGWERLAGEFAGTPAATKPSRDAEMKFPASSEVSEIPVKGGQKVKKGDLLVRARDAEVKAAIDQQRALAENDLEVGGATAQMELADIKFQNLEKAKAFSPQEWDEKRIEAKVAKVQRDQAVFNKDQQRLRLAQLEAQYERYRLVSPFDGIIEEVYVDLGQGVTEQDKVIRVVDIDRLWLDPTPPTALTIEQDLKEGSKAWVMVDLPGKPQLVEGRVLEVSPVADSVSLTRRVRVEIDNPKGWPAGVQAMVRFTKPEGVWAAMAETPPLSTLRAQSQDADQWLTEFEAVRIIAEMNAWGETQALTLADEIRQTVSEMMADQETLASLLGTGSDESVRLEEYRPSFRLEQYGLPSDTDVPGVDSRPTGWRSAEPNKMPNPRP